MLVTGIGASPSILFADEAGNRKNLKTQKAKEFEIKQSEARLERIVSLGQEMKFVLADLRKGSSEAAVKFQIRGNSEEPVPVVRVTCTGDTEAEVDACIDGANKLQAKGWSCGSIEGGTECEKH
jgi:hypothetical protein